MYAAYSAGLRSACLSRQVGAVITDSSGNILSTGCNDVPKARGGLYSAASDTDNRCYNQDGGKCHNDERKNLMQQKIALTIKTELNIDKEKADNLTEIIKKTSGLRDLLEFSRSVHAEMDAITTIARKGGISTQGAYLYTTTYPCHNCARHIIAAGIRKVFYIEPYEKSLARELHRDALEKPDTQADDHEKIGVSGSFISRGFLRASIRTSFTLLMREKINMAKLSTLPRQKQIKSSLNYWMTIGTLRPGSSNMSPVSKRSQTMYSQIEAAMRRQ